MAVLKLVIYEEDEVTVKEEVAVKEPSAFEPTIQAVDGEAGRSDDGTAYRDLIGFKMKIASKWKHVSPGEASDIIRVLKKPFFGVIYEDLETIDPATGAPKEVRGKFYAGPIKCPYERWNPAKGIRFYESISVNLVEQ
jgi:hypothetical protein